MSKKTNTLIFILVGTVFNVVITMSFFLLFLLIYSKFLYGRLNESAAAWALPVFFIAAIAASFLIYRLAIKLLIKKVDVENIYLPLLIPENLLNKEKEHVEGFAPEVAWVTKRWTRGIGRKTLYTSYIRNNVFSTLFKMGKLMERFAKNI